MKTALIYTLLLFTIVACKNKPKSVEKYTIKGELKNIPDGKVYLTEAYRWTIVLDSTIAANGKFVFNFLPDSTFYPKEVSIRYRDSSSTPVLKSLMFKNEFIPKNYINAFFLEPGLTQISQDSVSVPTKHGMQARIKAGKENEYLYKNHASGFGRIGNYTSTKRKERLNSFHQRIHQYPYSYLLLQRIYDNKEEYTEAELQDLLTQFDEEVQASALGNLVRTYLTNRNDTDEPYPDIQLLGTDNRRHPIINKEASLNMLVFWASWCGPCRQEIPLLKEIYEKYRGIRLNLVSISIDEDQERWKNALQMEKMPWPQFVTDKDKIEFMRQKFNFNSIPLVIFTDSQGNEIERFRGYSQERSKQYEAVINASPAQ